MISESHRDIIGACLYLAHALAVTVWFVSLCKYQTGRKQRTAMLFYVYCMSYTACLTVGFFLRAFGPQTYITCRVVWIGFYLYGALDAIILWIILKKDTSY